MDFRDSLSTDLPAPRDDEPAGLRQDILDELADHLACSYNRELLRGASPGEARRRAIERFGDPAAVARRLWLDAMKGKIMAQRVLIVTCLVVMAACFGLVGLAWIQSSLGRAGGRGESPTGHAAHPEPGHQPGDAPAVAGDGEAGPACEGCRLDSGEVPVDDGEAGRAAGRGVRGHPRARPRGDREGWGDPPPFGCHGPGRFGGCPARRLGILHPGRSVERHRGLERHPGHFDRQGDRVPQVLSGSGPGQGPCGLAGAAPR